MTLQEQIKSLLVSRGITQKTLSEKSGVCQKSLSYFLRYKHQFNLSTLQLIADAFDCDIVLMPKEQAHNCRKCLHYQRILNKWG